jgi:hypothetical protein
MFRRNVTADPIAELARLERVTGGMLTANGAVIYRATQVRTGR